MARVTETIEINVVCNHDQVQGVIAQASALDKVGIAQMLAPIALRNVFEKQHPQTRISCQFHNVSAQQNPYLENQNG